MWIGSFGSYAMRAGSHVVGLQPINPDYKVMRAQEPRTDNVSTIPDHTMQAQLITKQTTQLGESFHARASSRDKSERVSGGVGIKARGKPAQICKKNEEVKFWQKPSAPTFIKRAAAPEVQKASVPTLIKRAVAPGRDTTF
ncbi:hypothetical protein AgCh_028505 [Apium graveolens]